MKHSTTTATPTDPAAAMKLAIEVQQTAWHEIRLAMRRLLDDADPCPDDLDVLRAALAEYTMASRMLAAKA
jgi:hypothetical protein